MVSVFSEALCLSSTYSPVKTTEPWNLLNFLNRPTSFTFTFPPTETLLHANTAYDSVTTWSVLPFNGNMSLDRTLASTWTWHFNSKETWCDSGNTLDGPNVSQLEENISDFMRKHSLLAYWKVYRSLLLNKMIAIIIKCVEKSITIFTVVTHKSTDSTRRLSFINQLHLSYHSQQPLDYCYLQPGATRRCCTSQTETGPFLLMVSQQYLIKRLLWLN